MPKKGRWIKERRKLKDYPETEQQKKIRETGKEIKEKCTGLKGEDFGKCRIEVLDKVFKKGEQSG